MLTTKSSGRDGVAPQELNRQKPRWPSPAPTRRGVAGGHPRRVSLATGRNDNHAGGCHNMKPALKETSVVPAIEFPADDVKCGTVASQVLVDLLG